MPRLMSVALTEDAVRRREKTVTRRLGWLHLKPGERLTLCRKVMGRRKGEPLVRIAEVEVVSVRRERLDAISNIDVGREGFIGQTVGWFVEFFTASMRCAPDTEVTRIEWRYLTPDEATATRRVPGQQTCGDLAVLWIAEDVAGDRRPVFPGDRRAVRVRVPAATAASWRDACDAWDLAQAEMRDAVRRATRLAEVGTAERRGGA